MSAPVVEPEARAEALVEALPHLQRLRGQTVVVKYGGNAMTDPSLAETFAQDIVLLRSVGIRPVVVHGGGPQIKAMLARLGIETEFRDGLRVTDAETLQVVRMVLVGAVNRDIVAAINIVEPVAVGLSGDDAGLIVAVERDPSLGFVGDVASVQPAIVERLLAEDIVPVLSTVATDASGQAFNINADTVAGAVAGALGAAKAIFLTDVPGLLSDLDDRTSLVAEIGAPALQGLLDDGTLQGGMIPKAEACLHAVAAGAGSAHLLDGRVPHVVLLELLTDEGVGTMVTQPGAGS